MIGLAAVAVSIERSAVLFLPDPAVVLSLTKENSPYIAFTAFEHHSQRIAARLKCPVKLAKIQFKPVPKYAVTKKARHQKGPSSKDTRIQAKR